MTRNLLKDNASLLVSLMRLLDPMLLIGAGLVVHRAYLGGWEPPDRYVIAMLGMAAICGLLFPIVGLYAPQRGVTVFEEIRRLVNATLLLAAVWFGFLFLSKLGADFSRVWSIYWIALTLAVHLTTRVGIRLVLRRLRRQGYNLRHIVIVGAGRLGATIADRLAQSPWAGFVVRGFYDDNPALAGCEVGRHAVLGPVSRLPADLDREPVDQVWIALPLRADARIRELLIDLRRYPVQVRYIPDIFNFTLLNHSFTEIVGMPVINLTDSPLQGASLVLKDVEDFALAGLLLLVTSPLMLLIALGVKLTSPGPVFYRQERVTWNGERFSMLKFRSMPADAESATGPVWSKPGEKRATPFGAFLRRTSLDELPQFINVLRGEMSIVGPRPERPEFVDRFRREIPGYMQKHLVKAGITGWAQVNDLRGDTDLSERIEYDLYYIENWSIWFDLRIIALTIVHLLRNENAH
jgi:putative colanic acid biosynthesis UDP-glucose lipid carrier transferase